MQATFSVVSRYAALRTNTPIPSRLFRQTPNFTRRWRQRGQLSPEPRPRQSWANQARRYGPTSTDAWSSSFIGTNWDRTTKRVHAGCVSLRDGQGTSGAAFSFLGLGKRLWSAFSRVTPTVRLSPAAFTTLNRWCPTRFQTSRRKAR